MNTQNAGVSLYRPYIPDTPIHPQNNDTLSDTKADTPSLKSLALKYLEGKKAIHSAIQTAIHPVKKCIGVHDGSDTLLEAEKGPVHRQEEERIIGYQIETAALPPWIRRSINGETLDDSKERRCASRRCGGVFMRQEGESDESWGHKRYCSGHCYSGQPWLPVEGVLQ